MKHQEGFFKGVRDANIYFQNWLPESEPKAVLLIVHGLAEHSGRYMNVVNHFVPLSYAVYGIDHLGHGKSEGTRVYVKRFDDYTNTLKIYFDMIHRWQPNRFVRAAIESIAFQAKEIVDCMVHDSGLSLIDLRVDGGEQEVLPHHFLKLTFHTTF